MPKKKKTPAPYWTPERIAALVEASGLGTQAAFAAKARVTPSMLSRWVKGQSAPTPLQELALDCLAVKFGETPSGNNS